MVWVVEILARFIDSAENLAERSTDRARDHLSHVMGPFRTKEALFELHSNCQERLDIWSSGIRCTRPNPIWVENLGKLAVGEDAHRWRHCRAVQDCIIALHGALRGTPNGGTYLRPNRLICDTTKHDTGY